MEYKKSLLEKLGNTSNVAILDYGCGKGDFIEIMLQSESQPKQIVASDSSEEMIASISNRFKNEIKSGLVAPKLVCAPHDLMGMSFDKIICHNVLECVEDKIQFVNDLHHILKQSGILLLSHHDFDSVIYNSARKTLTRELVHHFADTKQDWQEHADGQMARKLPGILMHSNFKDNFTVTTWRIVERKFEEGFYGYLMASMLAEVGEKVFGADELSQWRDDLHRKSQSGDYYFAIDLVVCECNK